MSDQTEYEIEEAIAEEGTSPTWSDLSPNARRIVQKELAEAEAEAAETAKDPA